MPPLVDADLCSMPIHSLCFDFLAFHFFNIKTITKTVASVSVVATPTPTPIAIVVVNVAVSVASVVSDAVVVVVERRVIVVPVTSVIASEATS